MKTRVRVRVISYITASVLIILGAGITGFNLANSYKTTLQYTYQRSLSQLSDYISSIKTTLTKGVYANTPPQQYGLASKLMVDAEGAKNALSQLPISLQQEEGLQKYLAQISDFASYTIGTLSRNENLSLDNIKSLEHLAEYADKIAPLVEDISSVYSNQDIGLDYAKTTNITSLDNENKTQFDNSYLSVSESLADYPSLIYDGPFADSVQQKTPKLTENVEECTVQECAEKLSRISGIPVNQLTHKKRHSNLPVYVFTDNDFYGTVAINGGYICEMYHTASTTTTNNLSYSELLEKAKTFLKSNNIDKMKESYHITTNGKCTINFAYSDNNIIYYGDLIKVTISTDTGKIIGYNAEGYIMNHIPREKIETKLTPQQAKKSISKALNIVNTRKAMIPLSTGKEALCYEFLCIGVENEKILVYINSTTGLEEQIFILLENENGSLVM